MRIGEVEAMRAIDHEAARKHDRALNGERAPTKRRRMRRALPSSARRAARWQHGRRLKLRIWSATHQPDWTHTRCRRRRIPSAAQLSRVVEDMQCADIQ